MQKYIDEFLEFKLGRISKTSARDYRNSLNKFRDIVRKPLQKVGRLDIVKFRQIISDGYAPKAVEHHFNVLHAFIKFWSYEIKTISPERIEVPTARSNPHATITEEEHNRLMDCLEENDYDSLQKKLVLSLLWDCGMRIGELVSINLDDIDFDNKKVRINTEKTKKQRMIFWGDKTHKLLCKLLPMRWEIKRSNALFIGMYNTGEYSNRVSTKAVQRWLSRIKTRAGISRNIVLHSYRHSRIQRWISKGIPLPEVCYLSGHESMTSLEHYMRLGAEQIERRAREAL